MNAPTVAPLKTLTRTTWTVTAFSHSFRARYDGHCILTGERFYAGAEVKTLTLADGTVGLMPQSRTWGITLGTDGIEWRCNVSFNMNELESILANPEMKTVTLYNRDGKATCFSHRAADGSWTKGYGKVSAKQFAAQAAKSFAFSASR